MEYLQGRSLADQLDNDSAPAEIPGEVRTGRREQYGLRPFGTASPGTGDRVAAGGPVLKGTCYHLQLFCDILRDVTRRGLVICRPIGVE